MTAATLLTDLGDLAVASPTAAAATIWLWSQVDRTLALVYAACFLSLVATVGALKILAHAAAPAYQAGQLWSRSWGLSTGAPSGHAALSMFVFGGAALILLRLGDGASRATGVGLCIGAVMTVAVTRVTLRHHTIGDVAAGLVVGGAFAWLFARRLAAARRVKSPQTAWLLALLLAVPALALATGLRLPSTAVL